MGTQLPPKGHSPQFLANDCCGQTAGWIKMPRCGCTPRPSPHCVRWGPSPFPKKGHSNPPLFGPCLLWPNGRPSQLLLSSCPTTQAFHLLQGQRCAHSESTFCATYRFGCRSPKLSRGSMLKQNYFKEFHRPTRAAAIGRPS